MAMFFTVRAMVLQWDVFKTPERGGKGRGRGGGGGGEGKRKEKVNNETEFSRCLGTLMEI